MILILPTFYRYNITFTFINREVMLHKFNTFKFIPYHSIFQYHVKKTRCTILLIKNDINLRKIQRLRQAD